MFVLLYCATEAFDFAAAREVYWQVLNGIQSLADDERLLLSINILLLSTRLGRFCVIYRCHLSQTEG
jgi:hypothetical protein